MNINLIAAAAVLSVCAPALAQQQMPARNANPDVGVTVRMQDAAGRSVGLVQIRQLTRGMVFIAELNGLPPGPHGFHIHEHGRCDAPDFLSAGGHYNPTGAEHGFDSPRGAHVGDMPNIHVARDGTVLAEFHSARLLLSGPTQPAEGRYALFDTDGSAIVIHEHGDDYQASTPESTGGRIACGVIAAR
ncbi:superoxide dismutase family protein [Falsiroseomonas sp. E2-1-a20]|uniref:superoxide dismutase family protein n=1 Tax=Falsiroseomonas sp. E2-1-a20 TaxID=3239300 RepID=UPI003F34571E